MVFETNQIPEPNVNAAILMLEVILQLVGLLVCLILAVIADIRQL